jgi:hypothetical protein
MLGLRGTYDAIRTANGPAQHLAAATVGLSYCGMLYQMVPNVILIAWAITSISVAVSVVWLNKRILLVALLSDFVLSMLVLMFYLMHDPAPVGPVYYSTNIGGVARHAPQEMSMNTIEIFSHALSCVMMAGWTLYLSLLVYRQMLERARMIFLLEGEELK